MGTDKGYQPRPELGRLWVVVYVWRGMASKVETYASLEAAENRHEDLRRTGKIEDDVAVFQLDGLGEAKQILCA